MSAQEAKCYADVCDDRDENLPLHIAAQVGRLDLVETLVRDNFGERAEGRLADNVDQIGSAPTAVTGLAAITATVPSQTLRPRSYLQRQNRWGCTPHDLAFLDDHRDVARFLRECASEVETQHVLDRNLRIETDAAHRASLEVCICGWASMCGHKLSQFVFSIHFFSIVASVSPFKLLVYCRHL